MDAVLFDLDDTLCGYRVSGRELLARAFEAVAIEPCFSVAEYHAAYETHLDASDGMRDLRRRCFTELVEAAGHDPALGVALEAAYAESRDHGDVRALPGARAAVATLAEDHRLGLVTNGAPEMQRTKLDAIGLAECFETAVFGGFDVPAKPAPDPFERALADLDLGADRAVAVGNSIETDVAGAKAAGLRAVWLRNRRDADAPAIQPDYVVDSLAELAERPWA